jgi:hypothetical protein
VKYLLLSVIFALLVLPMLFSLDPSPRRGLRRAVLAVALYNAAYLLALYLTHPSTPPG